MRPAGFLSLELVDTNDRVPDTGRVTARHASRAEFRRSRGTEGSNPSPSSGESGANLIFGDESHR
jgi:hypothetical protein